MNGSNSLAETDSQPLHFCPVCHRKLLWNIGFDPLKRYTTLETFYRDHKLTTESDWLAKRIKHWSVAVEPAPSVTDE